MDDITHTGHRCEANDQCEFDTRCPFYLNCLPHKKPELYWHVWRDTLRLPICPVHRLYMDPTAYPWAYCWDCQQAWRLDAPPFVETTGED